MYTETVLYNMLIIKQHTDTLGNLPAMTLEQRTIPTPILLADPSIPNDMTTSLSSSGGMLPIFMSMVLSEQWLLSEPN